MVPRGGGPSVTRLIENGANEMCNSLVTLLAALGNVPLTCGGSVRRSGRTVFSTMSAIGVYLSIFAPVITSVAILGSGVCGTTRGNFVGTASLTSCLIGGNVPFEATCGRINRVITCYVGRGLILRALPVSGCGRFDRLFYSSLCGRVSLRSYITGHVSTNNANVSSVGGRLRFLTKVVW